MTDIPAVAAPVVAAPAVTSAAEHRHSPLRPLVFLLYPAYVAACAVYGRYEALRMRRR